MTMLNRENGQVNILYIEDDKNAAERVESVMEEQAYALKTVKNAVEALDVLKTEENFSVLIIPYEMPNESFNGIDFIRQIKKQFQFSGLIMLSGTGERGLIVEAVRAGAYDFIVKDENFSYISELPKVIAKVLEEKAEQDSAELEQAKREKQNTADTGVGSGGKSEKPVSNEQLSEKQDNLHDFFDDVPVGLYRIDGDGNFIDFNRTFLEMTGAPSRDTLLMDNLFYLFAHQGDKQNWFEIMRRDEQIRGLEIEIERYDGELIWGRDNAKPVYDEKGLIKYIDGSLENVTMRKETEKKLTFLATHDMLTGLPNRNFFNDQAALSLSQARYNGDILSVMLFDVDHFNAINANHGYPAGDDLLKQISKRVNEVLRKSDLLSRMSGDEFLLLISGVRGRRDIFSVAQKIISAFEKPFSIAGNEVSITVSIGISFYPDHGEDVGILIKHAEIAMYSVKNTKRGGYQIFSEDLSLFNSRDKDI